jgi:SAM-dependent methyltransferase
VSLDTDLVCPCGARRYRSVLEADRYCTYGDNVVEGYEYELRACLACGLVRTWPPPAHEEHAPFRDDSFIESYLAREALFDELLRPTVAEIARLAPAPGRFVDVGANIGQIVAMASARGYEATGIELNEAAVELGCARGHDLRALALEDAGFEPGSLDVICLSATAEHIPDLDETFALCRSLLKPGGLLYVSNSPNRRSFGARFERALWYGIQPTGHVWQFTPQTLRHAFERADLRVVARRTYNLERWYGRNRKERAKRVTFKVAERLGLGDAVSMAGVAP